MKLSYKDFFLSLANYSMEFEDEFGTGFTQEIRNSLAQLPAEEERTFEDYKELQGKIYVTLGSHYYKKRLLEGVRLIRNTGTSEAKPLTSPLKNKIKEVAKEAEKAEAQMPPDTNLTQDENNAEQ